MKPQNGNLAFIEGDNIIICFYMVCRKEPRDSTALPFTGRRHAISRASLCVKRQTGAFQKLSKQTKYTTIYIYTLYKWATACLPACIVLTLTAAAFFIKFIAGRIVVVVVVVVAAVAAVTTMVPWIDLKQKALKNVRDIMPVLPHPILFGSSYWHRVN